MILGLEFGGTKLPMVLGDGNGKIVQRQKLGVEVPRGAAGIREQIERALPGFVGRNTIRSVGVGFGGPVDWRTGRICRSHQVEGWSEFDMAGWLHGLTGVPVTVDNDANVACLGEALHGAGRGCNPVFYVTLGSGVGGGLVVDGRIYHGATPGEAEIGHVRLDRQGSIVESRCSGWAVDGRIRDYCAKEPGSVLAGMCPAGRRGGEAAHLPAALRQGDPGARRILQETAEDLAFGLSHVVHLFHPEILVIGGGLSGVGEPLRAAVEKALAPFLMDAFRPGPRVALAALGEDAVPTGALELAREIGPDK
jgi:glucokinase